MFGVRNVAELRWALSNQGPDMFTLARRAQITTWKASVFNAIDQWQRASQAIGMERCGSASHSTLGLTISNICKYEYVRWLRQRSDCPAD